MSTGIIVVAAVVAMSFMGCRGKKHACEGGRRRGGGFLSMLGLAAILGGVAIFLTRTTVTVNSDWHDGPREAIRAVEHLRFDPHLHSYGPARHALPGWSAISLGTILVIAGWLLVRRERTGPRAIRVFTILGIGAILFSVVSFFGTSSGRSTGREFVWRDQPVDERVATIVDEHESPEWRASTAKRPKRAKQPAVRRERAIERVTTDELPPRAGEIPVAAELNTRPPTQPAVPEPPAPPAATPAPATPAPVESQPAEVPEHSATPSPTTPPTTQAPTAATPATPAPAAAHWLERIVRRALASAPTPAPAATPPAAVPTPAPVVQAPVVQAPAEQAPAAARTPEPNSVKPTREYQTAVARTADGPTVSPYLKIVQEKDRPDWIDAPGKLVGRGVYRIAVKSGLFVSVPECQRELDAAIKREADHYIEEIIDHDAAGLAAVPLSYLKKHVQKAEYDEILESESVGSMHQIHALLEFDDATRHDFRQFRNSAIVTDRLWYTGGGAALVLALLGTFYGYLRLDQRTSGASRGRLQLAATLVALVVAAGALLARWALPF